MAIILSCYEQTIIITKYYNSKIKNKICNFHKSNFFLVSQIKMSVYK